MFHIFAIVGESGAGKTTLQDRLEKKGLNVVKGCSTRKMRKGEKEGNPYEFVSRAKYTKDLFQKKIIESIEYNGNVYYTKKEEFVPNDINIVILEPEGLKQILKTFGDNNVTGVMLCADKKIRMKRMFQRGDSVDEVKKRLKEDRETFKEKYMLCDYKIDSNDEDEDEEEMMYIILEVMEEKKGDK